MTALAQLARRADPMLLVAGTEDTRVEPSVSNDAAVSTSRSRLASPLALAWPRALADACEG